jgi:hypothetical protein
VEKKVKTITEALKKAAQNHIQSLSQELGAALELGSVRAVRVFKRIVARKRLQSNWVTKKSDGTSDWILVLRTARDCPQGDPLQECVSDRFRGTTCGFSS